MSHLRAFFCCEYCDYALFGVEFLAEICQKFSEILRILAEILRKKLATGASDLNTTAREKENKVAALLVDAPKA